MTVFTWDITLSDDLVSGISGIRPVFLLDGPDAAAGRPVKFVCVGVQDIGDLQGNPAIRLGGFPGFPRL